MTIQIGDVARVNLDAIMHERCCCHVKDLWEPCTSLDGLTCLQNGCRCMLLL